MKRLVKRLGAGHGEVRAGYECGLTLDGYNDIKEGDQLEFSTVELVKRTLA